MKILIKDVRVVDKDKDFKACVYIENGYVQTLSFDPLEDGQDCLVVEGEGKVLMPSFVDLHAHFRDPGFPEKEDIESGSKAALKGGYTTVNLMGNTYPICDNEDVYNYIIQKSDRLDMIDIQQVFAVTQGFDGKTIDHLDRLPKGVTFLSDDGKGILSNRIMYDVLNKIRETGIGIMVHEEDPSLSGTDYRIAEDLITIRDVYLAVHTGARVHFSHVSTKDSIEAIRYGKQKGASITCEVTPHHISLYDDAYRVNPPIRKKEDVSCIIEAIKDGTVDAIATDHAPHTKADKDKGAPGLIGLETAFQISYQHLVKEGHITLSKLSQLMSYNPAQILGLNRGLIEPGAIADLVLVDLEKSETILNEKIVSRSKNTPYIGMTFKGVIDMTIRQGNIKYSRGEEIDY